METKKILAIGVEVITFFFAAFGGFLLKIAPPEETKAPLAVGVSMLVCLVVLLGVAAMAKGSDFALHKKRWLIAAGVFLAVGLVGTPFYKWNTDRLVFGYPPENPTSWRVAGTEMTEHAQRKYGDKRMSNGEILLYYTGRSERVWTARSIRKAELILLLNYLSMTVGFGGAIFCLTEGILGRPGRLVSVRKIVANGAAISFFA